MNTALNILNDITGQLYLIWRRNREVWRQINHLERCKPAPNYTRPVHPLFDLETLLRHLRQEHGFRRIIEDKAKTNVLGITLAFTVILATVALAPRFAETAKNTPNWAIWTILAFQLLGILFLLIGGLLALKSLRAARNYIWSLQDERDHSTDEARNAEISWLLQSSELVSRLKANFLDASYCCIRNGVVSLVISTAIALIFLARAI